MESKVPQHGVRPALKKDPVAEIVGVSVRGLEIMIKDGRFIQPFYIGDRSPRWRAEDVERWLAEKATEAQAGRP